MLSSPLSFGRHKKQNDDVGRAMVWNCQIHSQEFSEENANPKARLHFLRERKAKTSGNSAPPTCFYTEVVD